MKIQNPKFKIQKLKILIFILLSLIFAGTASAQDNIYTIAGRTKIFTFKNSGNYNDYTLLFVAENSDGERVIQKTLSKVYAGPYTTMVCTLYVSDTEDLTTDASYPYDIVAYGADTVTVRSGLLNIMTPVQTSFDGTNLPSGGERVTTVSLENGTTLNSVVVWDTTNDYWAPMSFASFESLLNISTASVGDADSLGGVPASGYLQNDDSTQFRTFSDLKYLANGDSTDFRTFSDLKYLANGDSTDFRTFSDLKYLANGDSTNFRTFSDLKYLANGDSTDFRTFSDLKYLANGDSTDFRTFSDEKYLAQTAFGDSLGNYYFSGTDSIHYGATYIDITHGCGFTPLIKNIYVTPQSTTFGYPYWITNVGATTFRIQRSLTGDEAVTDKIIFSWQIRKP
jgi:hypothetical protein